MGGRIAFIRQREWKLIDNLDDGSKETLSLG